MSRLYDEMEVRLELKRRIKKLGREAVAASVGYAPEALDEMAEGHLALGHRLSTELGFRRVSRWKKIEQ